MFSVDHPIPLSGKPQRGFTLIELMVTIAILAILATIAVPSFQQAIASNRITSATNDLYSTLVQARSDAIRQGRRITVCVSTNGTSCDRVATSARWTSGWISFVDTTRSGTAPSVNAGETITYRTSSIAGSLVMVGNGIFTNYASFSADGQSKTLTGAIANGRIRVCSTSTSLTNDARARDIIITASGRTVIVRPTGVTASCPSPTATGD